PGVYPDVTDEPKVNSTKDEPKNKSIFPLWRLFSAMIVFLLFISIIVFTNQTSLVKKYAYTALTEDFPFATVHQWYLDKTKMIPLFDQAELALQLNDSVESSHTILETLQTTGTGMSFAPVESEEMAVQAIADGIVIFSGVDAKTNRTVIVQHADKTKAYYGNLSTIHVPLYKRLHMNDQIGQFRKDEDNEHYFLAVEEKGALIEPLTYLLGQID